MICVQVGRYSNIHIYCPQIYYVLKSITHYIFVIQLNMCPVICILRPILVTYIITNQQICICTLDKQIKLNSIRVQRTITTPEWCNYSINFYFNFVFMCTHVIYCYITYVGIETCFSYTYIVYKCNILKQYYNNEQSWKFQSSKQIWHSCFDATIHMLDNNKLILG